MRNVNVFNQTLHEYIFLKECIRVMVFFCIVVCIACCASYYGLPRGGFIILWSIYLWHPIQPHDDSNPRRQLTLIIVCFCNFFSLYLIKMFCTNVCKSNYFKCMAKVLEDYGIIMDDFSIGVVTSYMLLFFSSQTVACANCPINWW